MDIASNIHQYLDSLKVEYYSGDYVTLQEDWRYNNIVPGYNKFYYIEKGEFYLEINGQSYNASKGCLLYTSSLKGTSPSMYKRLVEFIPRTISWRTRKFSL